jgi:Ca-activated chloride channel family protein
MPFELANPNAVAVPVGLAVLFLAALAERLHVRRCRAVARLAFGPSGSPRGWTRAVPALRVLAAGAAAWGLALLALAPTEPLDAAVETSTTAVDIADLQRIILLLDVSPSMNIVDAGPEGDLRRRDRIRDVVEAIFPRIALGRTRFSIVAFFTSAAPVVVDASDVNVIRNALDSLPLIYAFEPGKTDLVAGLNSVAELARDWPPQSTTLLVCTDGDTVDFSQIPKLPRSIKQTKLLAVGDPLVGTFIDNHDSRQQAGILRQVAAELRGSYYDVNVRHLPTTALSDLAESPPPPPNRAWSWKDAALVAVGLAAVLLTLIPLALEYYGCRWNAEAELPAPLRLAEVSEAVA